MLAALARTELFASLSVDSLVALSRNGRARTFGAQTQMIRQGRVNRALFVILSGRDRVERWHPQMTEPVVLAEVGPVAVVGADGIFDEEPSVTSVIVIAETRVIELSAAALAQVILGRPEDTAILLRILSRRMTTVRDLAEKAVARGWDRVAELT